MLAITQAYTVKNRRCSTGQLGRKAAFYGQILWFRKRARRLHLGADYLWTVCGEVTKAEKATHQSESPWVKLS
jgi:hypothetical protein